MIEKKIIWQLTTKDLRHELEIPNQYLLQLFHHLASNGACADAPDMIYPQSKAIGFVFTKEEFRKENTRDTKKKEKKMVSIEYRSAEKVQWIEGWEKFRKPEFIITDISNFIEREGNYTSFLNECIQKALTGVMKIDTSQTDAQAKNLFIYSISISGEHVMSMEIEGDTKEKAKMIGSSLVFAKLFPAVSRIVEDHFDKRSKDSQVIEQKEARKKEKQIADDEISRKKNELMKEMIRKTQKTHQPETASVELPARVSVPAINPTDNILEGLLNEPTRLQTTPVDQATPKQIEESLAITAPSNNPGPKKWSEPQKQTSDDHLQPEFSTEFKCTMNTVIQDSVSLLGEFLAIFRGKGLFANAGTKSLPKFKDVRSIIQKHSNSKFKITVKTAKGGHIQCAVVKKSEVDDSCSDDDDNDDTAIVMQYVARDAEIARDVMASTVVAYCD